MNDGKEKRASDAQPIAAVIPIPARTERVIAETDVPASAAGETPAGIPTATGAFLVAPTGGRRDIDEGRIEIVELLRPLRDAFFWLFGIFLETKPPHKPSITRVSWWVVIVVGVGMFFQEITHRFGAHTPSNAAWQAWAIAFTVCGTAVGFPKAVDFWKNGGAAAIGSIATAVRDKLPEREPNKKDDERHDA